MDHIRQEELSQFLWKKNVRAAMLWCQLSRCETYLCRRPHFRKLTHQWTRDLAIWQNSRDQPAMDCQRSRTGWSPSLHALFYHLESYCHDSVHNRLQTFSVLTKESTHYTIVKETECVQSVSCSTMAINGDQIWNLLDQLWLLTPGLLCQHSHTFVPLLIFAF